MKHRPQLNATFFALILAFGLGCDKAGQMAQDGEKAAIDAAKKGAELAKKEAAVAEQMSADALAKAKEEYVKLTSGQYEAIEQKIKDQASEKAAEAQALFEKLKAKVESLKETAPEKFKEAKAEIEQLVTELKDKLGLGNK